MLAQKLGVDSNQTFRVQRSTHVIDISFVSTFKSCKVCSAESVQDPGQAIFFKIVLILTSSCSESDVHTGVFPQKHLERYICVCLQIDMVEGRGIDYRWFRFIAKLSDVE